MLSLIRRIRWVPSLFSFDVVFFSRLFLSLGASIYQIYCVCQFVHFVLLFPLIWRFLFYFCFFVSFFLIFPYFFSFFLFFHHFFFHFSSFLLILPKFSSFCVIWLHFSSFFFIFPLSSSYFRQLSSILAKKSLSVSPSSSLALPLPHSLIHSKKSKNLPKSLFKPKNIHSFREWIPIHIIPNEVPTCVFTKSV